ncbi:unnamed protein product [Microthlaspi erraticum]|uniref:WIT1/2 N-terminal helical bundle domain-containing protein n=1 Tax=Microthlaspi erraticum TaxID=1685480 RepID=A0A6D2JSX0_9BRAS|nr:unnamed protein product [Microthlaspi erraticum]
MEVKFHQKSDHQETYVTDRSVCFRFPRGAIVSKNYLVPTGLPIELVNLSLLTMQLGSREHDFESSFVSIKEEEEEASSKDDDSAEKALEFDLLSSILDSEVKELESILAYL